MFRSVTLVVAGLVMGAGTAPAQSQPIKDRDWVVTQVRVPVGDLDLTRVADADALLRRVALAAARACRSEPALGVLTAEEARAYRACKVRAIARTVAQVDAPLVKAQFARRGGAAVKVAEVRP